MSSNVTRNQVPSDAIVGVDIRYIPEDTRFTTEASALQFLQELAPNAVLHVVEYEPCHSVSSEHSDIQFLAAAIQKITDEPTEFIRKPGAADVRYYSALGIPAVVLGVQGQGPHTDDEYVQLSSLQQYMDSLHTFLKTLKI